MAIRWKTRSRLLRTLLRVDDRLQTLVAFVERGQRPLRRLGDVREWRMIAAAGKPVTLIVTSGRPRHAAPSLIGVGPAIRTP